MLIGTNNIADIKLGNNQVDSVYLGTNLVWQKPLLDKYPSAAAAYSLRRLRSAYTGSAIRVRRSSDNTEQDIGFIGQTLDVPSLLSFVGAGSGFVVTWYDQSVNGNNATQTTLANQPIIVNSGNLETKNSKACVNFFQTQSRMLTGLISSFSLYSHTIVATPDTLTSNFSVFNSLVNSSGNAIGVRATLKLYDANLGILNDNAANNTVALGEQVLLYSQNVSNQSDMYKNGSLIATKTGTTTTGNRIFLGTNGLQNLLGTKSIQEYILYTSNQSSNRTGIEDNINQFYGIY